MIFLKGATMLEWQIGRLYGGWCYRSTHTHGKRNNQPGWLSPRRFSFGWDRT